MRRIGRCVGRRDLQVCPSGFATRGSCRAFLCLAAHHSPSVPSKPDVQDFADTSLCHVPEGRAPGRHPSHVVNRSRPASTFEDVFLNLAQYKLLRADCAANVGDTRVQRLGIHAFRKPDVLRPCAAALRLRAWAAADRELCRPPIPRQPNTP